MGYDVLGTVAVVGCACFAASYALAGGSFARLVRTAAHARKMLPERRAGPAQARRGKAVEKAWRRQIVRDMPGFLDIVVLGLSAGLSFDTSLELYCSRYETDLARELWEAAQQWRIGARSREQALEELAERVDVPAMTRFAGTVVEALAFGSPLSETLERQALVIRAEQRALMEEQIEQAPVKMLVPLATLILPAMLISIMGPLLGPAISTM